MQPVGSDAGIVFLEFSVIVLTEGSSHLELLIEKRTNVSTGSNPEINVNSSKFDKNSLRESNMAYFFQWVTGKSGRRSSSRINYWTTLSVSKSYSSSYDLRISFTSVGSRIYMTGFQVRVLLAAKVVNQS